MNQLIRKADLRIESLEDRTVPSAPTDLGVADQFNALVFQNYIGYNSDVGGRLAIGNNGSLKNYGIGDQLTNTASKSDTLIDNNNLTYENGQVFEGNVVYGNSAHLASVNILNGSLRQQLNDINFSQAQTDLTTTSNTWSTYYANGGVTSQWGSLLLTGNDPHINTFSITEDQLRSTNYFSLNVPQGSTVLINVSGTNPSMQNFYMNLNGLSPSHVVFNFYQAQSLLIQNMGIEGSILAPNAAVSFFNGSMDGTLVASSFNGNAQLHNVPNQLDVLKTVAPNGFLGGQVFVSSEGGFSPFNGVAEIILNGTTSQGSYHQTTTTDSFGNFSFGKLPPGTYSLSIVDPNGYTNGADKAGSLGGSAGSGTITNIVVNPNDSGSGYNFSLVPV